MADGLHAASLPDSFAAFNALSDSRDWACTCYPAADFDRPELTGVSALWREKAADRAMPARADLDARALKPYLANMTLLERVTAAARPHYRLRIHGTSLARYAGDHTGRIMEEEIPAPQVDAYRAVYDLLLQQAVPARVLWNYRIPAISYLHGESFVAPLRAGDGTASLLLSVTYTKTKKNALTTLN